MNQSISIFTGTEIVEEISIPTIDAKKSRKRYGAYDRRGKLSDQVSIDERLAVLEERGRGGAAKVTIQNCAFNCVPANARVDLI